MARLPCIALLGCACAACVPAGNTDPEVFRAEYEAVARAMGETRVPLHAMEFVTMSWGELQDWCSQPPCAGHAVGSTVMLPPLDDDRCRTAAPMSDEVQASIVIHEILHAQGYEHGHKMTAVQTAAWKSYQQRECQQ